MKKIEIKKPEIKFRSFPKEVQDLLLQTYLLYIFYMIFFIAFTIVVHDIVFFKFGITITVGFLLYSLHLSYLFFYSKIRVVEGIIKEKESTKLGSYIYLEQGNLYFKIRVKRINAIRKGSVVRYYYVDGAIFQKDADLYVINGYILAKTIKNNFNS